MKKFYYILSFDPNTNFVKAKNKKEALLKIKKLWSKYNPKNIDVYVM